MKLNLSPNDWSRVDHLFEVLARNIDISDYINSFLASPLALANEKTIQTLAKRFQLNDADAMLHYLVKSLSGGRTNKFIESLVLTHVKPSFVELSPQSFMNNPFTLSLPSLEAHDGDWHLHTTLYRAFEFFIYNDVTVASEDYKETLQLGYFAHPFTYLTVDEQNVNWMSITPNEITTMEHHLSVMHGKVLVLGLGLGYFAARCAFKDTVSNVTIIERDPRVIQLFDHHIRPHLRHEDKITIIQEDAISFMKRQSSFTYDTVFIDLWHTADDGLPLYLALKGLEAHISSKHPFAYWIETSLLAMLRRVVLTVISELRDGATDRDFQRRENLLDDIINAVYFYTKELTFSSYEQLHTYLSDDSLRILATQLNFTYHQN